MTTSIQLQTGGEVQSLLFAVDRWTVRDARRWAREHGYRDDDVDETRRYIHLRQEDPVSHDHGHLRTISFGSFARTGIKAIIQWHHIDAGELAKAARQAHQELRKLL